MIRKILSKIIPWLVAFFTGSNSPSRIKETTVPGRSKAMADGTPRRGTLLENQSIPSAHLMGGRGWYDVYLPPQLADFVPGGGDLSKEGLSDGVFSAKGLSAVGERYPVLYLFHGMGDDHSRWESKGHIGRFLEKAWADGSLPPMICVMPNAYLSFYIDGLDFFDGAPGHAFQSFFEQELQPYLEKTFPVLTDREHTFIAGISMGGYGALRYAVLHPEKYILCYSMSGATEGLNWTGLIDNVPAIADLIEQKYGSGAPQSYAALPELILECGNHDPLVGHHNKVSHRRLTAMGVPHRFTIHKGSHTWQYWHTSIPRLLTGVRPLGGV